MARGVAIGVPEIFLLAPDSFPGRFSSGQVAEALRQGLAASGQPAEVLPLLDGDGEPAMRLAAAGYDERMRRARAVITGAGALDRSSLTGSFVAEVATRARQAGVPCHAVVGRNDLSRFELRILDLQLVLEAGTLAEIADAAARISARRPPAPSAWSAAAARPGTPDRRLSP